MTFNSRISAEVEHPALSLDGPPHALLHICVRVVKWVASFGTMNNRITWAEANALSEGEVAAASELEEQVLLEIIDLAVTISDMHAVNQVEIEGKQCALNALTSIHAWERDSLYALRCSIERDQLEVNAVLFATLQPPAQRASWLTRFNPRVAKG